MVCCICGKCETKDFNIFFKSYLPSPWVSAYPYVEVINMLINEVSKITDLTKKAIEYYTEKGLTFPSILENGYREFSLDDVEQLKKIAVHRKLGISTEVIKKVLSDESRNTLQILSVQKELNLQREHAKKSILDKLSSGKSYFEISTELFLHLMNQDFVMFLQEATNQDLFLY